MVLTDPKDLKRALKRHKLPEDEVELLASPGGLAALSILLPFIRDLIIYLEGGDTVVPRWLNRLPKAPDLRSEAAMEKLRLKRLALKSKSG